MDVEWIHVKYIHRCMGFEKILSKYEQKRKRKNRNVACLEQFKVTHQRCEPVMFIFEMEVVKEKCFFASHHIQIRANR